MPIPKRGDRSAWDTIDYGNLHAKDIEDGTPIYHLPENPDDGDVPVWDSANGKWVASPQTSGSGAAGDMLKSVYDTDNDGKVNEAEAVAWAGVTSKPTEFNPEPHDSDHKLDDLATPDDNTDLNASVSRHGLLPKLSGSTSEYLNGLGQWATPSSGSSSGSSSGVELYSVWDPDAPPESATAQDDEFSDSSFNTGKWTELDPDDELTITENTYGLLLSHVENNYNYLNAVLQAIPSGDFSITAKFSLIRESSEVNVGLVLTNASSGDSTDAIFWSLKLSTSNPVPTLEAALYTDLAYDDYLNEASQLSPVYMYGTPIYLKIFTTGSRDTYEFAFSTDGLGWIRLWQADTISITPTHFGIGIIGDGSSARALWFRYYGGTHDESVPAQGRMVTRYA